MNKKFLFFFLIFYFILLLLPKNSSYIQEDSAQYLILAKSIKEGKVFRMLNFPYKPFCKYYPPLWPLILSLFISSDFQKLNLASLLTFILLTLIPFILYRIYKLEKNKKDIFLFASILFFLTANFLYLKSQFLSEPLFLVLIYLCFISFSHYLKYENLSWLIISSFLTGLAYLTRYIGILLFISLLFFLTLKKKKLKEVLIFSLIFLLFYIPWEIRNMRVNTFFHPSILKTIMVFNPYWAIGEKNGITIISNYFTHFNWLLYDFTSLFIPIKGFKLIRYLIMIFFILGISLRIKEKLKPYDFFTANYLLSIPLWPFFLEYKRLLLPILPFLYFYLISGLTFFIRNMKLKKICLFFLASFFLISNFYNLTKITREPKGYKEFTQLCYWIRNKIKKEEIILSSSPARTYLYSNHQTIYSTPFNPTTFYKISSYYRVKYILYNKNFQSDLIYISPIIKIFKFRILKKIGDCYLLVCN